MIISEEHRFAFVHIPKCAGTSVRKILQPLDSRGGEFTARIGHHTALGQLDYVHIPLFSLRDYFPAEFEAVRDYWSFAVMRDPFARFASSVSEHIKTHSAQPIHMRSEDEVRSAINDSIDYLSQQPQERHHLAAEYIHFQRQIDYIELEGARVVDKVYTVNDVGVVSADINRHVGHNLLQTAEEGNKLTANRSVVFRNDLLRRMIGSARPISNRLGKVLPNNVKQMIRDHVYIPRDQRLKDVFESDQVREFIRDYYVDDISLYQHVVHSRKDKVS